VGYSPWLGIYRYHVCHPNGTIVSPQVHALLLQLHTPFPPFPITWTFPLTSQMGDLVVQTMILLLHTGRSVLLGLNAPYDRVQYPLVWPYDVYHGGGIPDITKAVKESSTVLPEAVLWRGWLAVHDVAPCGAIFPSMMGYYGYEDPLFEGILNLLARLGLLVFAWILPGFWGLEMTLRPLEISYK